MCAVYKPWKCWKSENCQKHVGSEPETVSSTIDLEWFLTWATHGISPKILMLMHLLQDLWYFYILQEQLKLHQQVFDKIAERLSASRQLFAQIKVIVCTGNYTLVVCKDSQHDIID